MRRSPTTARLRLPLAVVGVCVAVALTAPVTGRPDPVDAGTTGRFQRIANFANRTTGPAAQQLQQRLSAVTHLDTGSRFGRRGEQRQAPSTAMNAEMVSATVLLAGESITGARTRIERLGQRFDRTAAQRRIDAQQAVALPGLRAAGATVQHRITQVLNAITVRVPFGKLAALAAAPGVASVHRSYTLHLDNATSDAYTGTPSVWGGSSPLGQTGAGMVIGIIDDGLDYTHADFGGSGDPADYLANDPTTLTDAALPSKVLGGWDFVGDDYSANPDVGQSDVPVPDPDPLACGEHGTHVAGTAAGMGVLGDGSTFTGPYNSTTLTSHTFSVAPGSAPAASLRIYKVFGCNGSVADDVIIAAIERAVTDDVDVLNLSLGSSWGGFDSSDPLAAAIDAATASGVLSVISAGNSGSGAYLVGGPSTANTALSVAAADTSTPLLDAITIYGPAVITAQNSNRYTFPSGNITSTVVNVGLGCAQSDFSGTSGKIAVAYRGTCDRVDRAVFGDIAGAVAVVFVNTSESYPPVEGPISGVDIPFVGVPASVGDLLVDGTTLTLQDAGIITNPRYTYTADFSSSGPRLDNALKPDITAPGVSLWSAAVGSGTGGIGLSGTSMASPHMAGIATLVRQAHPTWTPQMVKGAIMATADPSKVGDYDVVRNGAGMVVAPNAVGSLATITTTDGLGNLSFGFHEVASSLDISRSFTIHNTSGSAVTYDLSAQFDDDVVLPPTATITPSTVTVSAGGTATVNVRLVTVASNLVSAMDSDAGALSAIDGTVIATPRSTPTGIRTLRVPMLLVAVGTSDVRPSTTLSPALRRNLMPQLVKRVGLRNRGQRDGMYDTYQWAITDAAGDAGTGVADLRDVGVQNYNDGVDDLVVFAINTEGRTTSHNTMEYDVWIDTDADDVAEFVVLGIDQGLAFAGDPDGVMVSVLVDVRDNAFTAVSGFLATAPANGSTVLLPVLRADLEASAGTPLHFYVDSWSVLSSATNDSTDEGWFDPWNPALDNGDFDWLAPDDTFSFRPTLDLGEVATQHALGWLVVALDDASGAREADRVPYAVRRPQRTVG